MGGGFTRFTPKHYAWIPYAIIRSNQGNDDEQCSINEESQYGNNIQRGSPKSLSAGNIPLTNTEPSLEGLSPCSPRPFLVYWPALQYNI